MKITQDNYIRLDNCINGNPRYYLPVYLAQENNARELGGVKYRGKQYGAGWVFSSYNLQGDCDRLNDLEGNKDEPKHYQRVRMIEACALPPTNTRGCRVKIFEKARGNDDRQKTKIVGFDYENDSVQEQAQALLEKAGFNIVCVSSWRDSYVFLVDNWGSDYVEIKDIK